MNLLRKQIMALREFVDSKGVAWKAWDVPPWRVYSQTRSNGDRRVTVVPGYQPERRQAERRRRTAAPGLEHGWLCFECDNEKRRLIPPPPSWADVPDAELAALCGRASPAQPQL
jgi:hypothetical protein